MLNDGMRQNKATTLRAAIVTTQAAEQLQAQLRERLNAAVASSASLPPMSAVAVTVEKTNNKTLVNLTLNMEDDMNAAQKAELGNMIREELNKQGSDVTMEEAVIVNTDTGEEVDRFTAGDICGLFNNYCHGEAECVHRLGKAYCRCPNTHEGLQCEILKIEQVEESVQSLKAYENHGERNDIIIYSLIAFMLMLFSVVIGYMYYRMNRGQLLYNNHNRPVPKMDSDRESEPSLQRHHLPRLKLSGKSLPRTDIMGDNISSEHKQSFQV